MLSPLLYDATGTLRIVERSSSIQPSQYARREDGIIKRRLLHRSILPTQGEIGYNLSKDAIDRRTSASSCAVHSAQIIQLQSRCASLTMRTCPGNVQYFRTKSQ